MNCRLCKNSGNFGKSHVIPESFFLHRKVEGETPLITSSKDGFYPKRRPIGEYDTNILCKGCETTFNTWDDYGKTLLLDKIDEFEVINENNIAIGYQLNSFDYQKLKMFFISVLWRAGVSERDFYKKVSLGPHEQKLREMVLNSDAGKEEAYATQLFRFSQESFAIPILMPMKIKSSYGYTYYRIYLGDYFADIKVDKRPTPRGCPFNCVTDG